MQGEGLSQSAIPQLNNPFDISDSKGSVIGHISGRRTDIAAIVGGKPRAIILAGAPNIGKSMLISYLERSPAVGWSWRDELANDFSRQTLETTHFIQIDLAHLEGIEDKDDLLNAFIDRCASALYKVYKKKEPPSGSMSLRMLVDLLREISDNAPNARHFLMLDTLDRLGRFNLPSFVQSSSASNEQERGLALLDHCQAIRNIVNLMDEFRILGFILSINNLPRSRVVDQFTHISADLARFTTMTLQTFTRQDTERLLAQEAGNFGKPLADAFAEAGIINIFTEDEQQWLRQQAGTHPYLLQQLCFYAFHLKQEYLKQTSSWTALDETGKQQLTDWTNESKGTFFATTWKRLQEAIRNDLQTQSRTTREFQECILLFVQAQSEEEIKPEYWNSWGRELRYILSSEGIVRHDPYQKIYLPGELLRLYLVQKAQVEGILALASPPPSSLSGHEHWLTIRRNGQQERLPLSALEYLLFQALLHHPKNCSESKLMQAAWKEQTIDKAAKGAFTQRMYHLRKKLRDRCGTEIIENRYGGLYSLNHSEWFQLE